METKEDNIRNDENNNDIDSSAESSKPKRNDEGNEREDMVKEDTEVVASPSNVSLEMLTEQLDNIATCLSGIKQILMDTGLNNQSVSNQNGNDLYSEMMFLTWAIGKIGMEVEEISENIDKMARRCSLDLFT